jgi:predicted transcriptional regulator
MKMNEKFNQIMEKLNDNDKTYLSKFIKVVNDPLGRKILAKMASPKSPICYEHVPLELLGGSKIGVMSMLKTMEEIGLAKSAMEKREAGVFRTYSVTSEGRSLVEQHMQKEAKLFA